MRAHPRRRRAAGKDERTYLLHDHMLVWDVVERELPSLRPRLERLSRQLAEGDAVGR